MPEKMDTYVLIDASNIRVSCLTSCGFRIDFLKMYDYFKNKYGGELRFVGYYEGIARGDKKKRKLFRMLEEKGCAVRSLERKSYVSDAEFREYECSGCGAIERVEVRPRNVKLKSNVDVYLASEMVKIALKAEKPVRIILVSCDGDYAEAIRVIAEESAARIMVIATPPVEDYEKNTLSSRLKQLRRELGDRYSLNNIADIQEKIEAK